MWWVPSLVSTGQAMITSVDSLSYFSFQVIDAWAYPMVVRNTQKICVVFCVSRDPAIYHTLSRSHSISTVFVQEDSHSHRGLQVSAQPVESSGVSCPSHSWMSCCISPQGSLKSVCVWHICCAHELPTPNESQQGEQISPFHRAS